MPKFVVDCAHRANGESYQVLIEAKNALDARRAATAQGHIVGNVTSFDNPPASPPPPPAPQAPPTIINPDAPFEVRQLLTEVQALRRGRMLNWPVSTIATGVAIGIFLGMILTILVSIALARSLNLLGDFNRQRDAERQQRPDLYGK